MDCHWIFRPEIVCRKAFRLFELKKQRPLLAKKQQIGPMFA
jgi:hypothetical protein